MTGKLRVVQWATGGVGRAAIEAVLLHPDLELVGCWVHSADKHGKDVGEIVGTDPVGVVATNDVDEILALEADAVVYAPILPSGREVAALLRSGKNVVTPVGWFYPEPGHTDRIDEACREGGTSLHGTGINPGGATDLHPILFSSLSSGVRFVRGEEFTDIRSYAAPDVLRGFMGFGGTARGVVAGTHARHAQRRLHAVGADVPGRHRICRRRRDRADAGGRRRLGHHPGDRRSARSSPARSRPGGSPGRQSSATSSWSGSPSTG